ncbi:protein of unknown function [Pseudomonas mediterranea]
MLEELHSLKLFAQKWMPLIILLMYVKGELSKVDGDNGYFVHDGGLR